MTPKLLFLGCCVALTLFGCGLFQFHAGKARKGALLCFWLATGGAVWGATGAPWAGLLTLALWIVFPLSEIVFVLRGLQLPGERILEEAPPPIDEFPELRALTRDLQDLDFVKTGDCSLVPPVQEQFFRLFGRRDGLHHGAIGYVAEGGTGFGFTAFSSEDRQGRQWTTWDYPLSYALKAPPQLLHHRALDCATPAELFARHLAWLRLNGVSDADLVSGADAAAVRGRIERSLARQLSYNVRIGILAPRGKENDLGYSWRGTLYVAAVVVRDLVRL